MRVSAYQFGEFRLDLASFALLRNGYAEPLERKPFELLILLVSSGGRLITRAEIAECLWPKEVFVDTEHGINTAVRKVRAALRDHPDRPRFVQTVTGMGYRFIAPTEVIAEQPPEHLAPPVQPVPLPPEEFPAQSNPARQEARRPTRWFVLAAVLVILLTGMLWFATRGSGVARAGHVASAEPIHSVAVLPLANYSADPGQEYFADGMTDELITMLARDSTLRIPSRTSVMHYKSPGASIKDVGRSLGVEAVVEGSIDRSGERVHLNLQLIRIDSDSHLWAESYDRKMTEVAALPEDAARAIAARLNSASTQQSPLRYVSLEAHDAYLQGHYLWSVGRNEEAGKLFEKSVALQPDYALGWTGVSQYYSAGAKMGLLDPAAAMPKATAAAETAVSLDPNLPQAHSMLAAALFFGNWDGERALQEVTRATDLDPRFAEAWHLHAMILCAMGRFDEAVRVQKKGTALDPVTHPAAMAEILYFAGRYDASLSEAQMRARDFPDARDLLYFLTELNHWKGADDRAAQYAARLYSAPGVTTPNPEVLAAYKAHGYRGILEWRVATLLKQQKSGYISPVILAYPYAELGDREKALSLLEEGLHQHDSALPLAFDYLAYAPYRHDPRFRSLVRSVNLAADPQ